ncbi:MAG: RNA polymerase sigma factor [Polyangiaceae bacterium]|nr:RNA polymerase sigma factor [Polyangiaceae bacterium]
MDVDRGLVLALRRKEPGALDGVYRVYRERIWRLLARLAWSRAEAEDLFQETWLAVARHGHKLREDSNLGVWLYTIARNKHRNSLRSGARGVGRRLGFERLPIAPSIAPDEAADINRELGRVAAALARLPDAHREVLLLCVGERLPRAEVARILGISEEALRKRLSRARAALDVLLDSNPAEVP